MSKTLKKEGTPLKFDTSSQNINCFIHCKDQAQQPESKINANARSLKKKNKNGKQKPIQFQEKIFLQSVVRNILNDTDCQGINQLIQSMQFTANKVDNDHSKSEPYEEIQHLKLNQIFRDQYYMQQQFACFDKQRSSYLSSVHHLYACSPSSKPNDIHSLTTAFHSHAHSISMSPRQPYPSNTSLEINEYASVNYPLYYYQDNSMNQPQYSRRYRQFSNNQENFEFIIQKEKVNLQLSQIEADGRTTIMIRHIPNKYTEQMLKNEMIRYKNKINFVYLPLDRENSCNVGYAFVNFIDTKFISSFYEEFNGKKWQFFNSQKICELAYARIQGTSSLIDHYENSLQIRGRTTANKNQDKKLRTTFDFNRTTINDLSKMIMTQQEEKV